jgi:class 3 adenylate cyclase
MTNQMTTSAQGSPREALPPRFRPRLLFKITLPYVALATVLALAVIYVVARMQADTIISDFSRQVDETRLRVADSVVRTEQSQLTDLRTLARLDGLATAVANANQTAALNLITPYAISQNIERVIVVESSGRMLGGLRSDAAGQFSLAAPIDVAAWPFVAAVLQQVTDQRGDKYAGLVDDGDPTLYTATPIYDHQTQVGVLLIGTTAHTLVEHWRAASLADVTLYGDSGAPLATSFGADSPDSFEPARVGALLPRELTLGSRGYTEIVAPLVLRSGPTSQYIGVALSKAGPTELLRRAEVVLLSILAAGIVAAILLGIGLSRRITGPITALVRAAEGVATGDLDQELPVTTGDEIGALTASFNAMAGGLRERERMRDLLGRFVSPTIARLVLSRPLALSGESKVLSILFTDLRDFTSITEREDPTVVIRGLNDYFRIVVEAADRHGGIVNKFGGDSTLVLFGLTEEQGDVRASATSAVRAALEIRDGMNDLNRQRQAQRLPPLGAGIGINTGAVIAGLIGAERRMEYTVIGDAVNLSARIQALNRELEGDILISDATYAALGAPEDLEIIDYGLHYLKGKSNGVRVYAVTSWEVAHVV